MDAKEFYAIQTGVEKTTADIKSKMDKIVNKSIFKKIYYKIFPKTEFQEFQMAFEYLLDKKNEMYSYKNTLEKMNSELKKENEELEKTILELEKTDEDKETIVQMRGRLVTNAEMIMNQIPITIDMIDTFLNKLEKTLPHMETTIKKRIMINTSLKALALLIDNVIELEEYSKSLEKQNISMIDELVGTTTEKIINSVDIEHYKLINERNKSMKTKYDKMKMDYFSKLDKLDKELYGIQKDVK